MNQAMPGMSSREARRHYMRILETMRAFKIHKGVSYMNKIRKGNFMGRLRNQMTPGSNGKCIEAWRRYMHRGEL